MLDSKAVDSEGSASSIAGLDGCRVLIVVENLPVPFDRRVWQEARTLHSAGAKVSVICPTGKGYEELYERLEGIDIYRHKLPTESNTKHSYLHEYLVALIAQTRLAWKVYLTQGIDVFHACNPPDLIFLVAAPFKLLGTRFIFDHHDLGPELYLAKFGARDFFYNLMCLIERLTFWLADASIATNDSYKEIAISRGKMSANKVFVVRSGPDINRVYRVTSNNELRNNRKFLVGYVGVMGPQEGIDLLLKSVDYLVNKKGRLDIQFCLVGGGPSLGDLKKMAKEMGLSEFVAFTGRVPDSDLLEIISTADICVNPDRVNKMNDLSTMNKILEYMTIGKPIVQFDVKEGRVSADQSSLYAKSNDPIDFGDKIEELLADFELRERMGSIGRNRILTKFSWQTQIPKLLSAYRSIYPPKSTSNGSA